MRLALTGSCREERGPDPGPQEGYLLARGGLAHADHLAGLADAERPACRPAQCTEVLHSMRRGPAEGVFIAASRLGATDDLGGVIDAERLAVLPTQRAQIP